MRKDDLIERIGAEAGAGRPDLAPLAAALADGTAEDEPFRIVVGCRWAGPVIREALVRRGADPFETVIQVPGGLPSDDVPGWAAGLAMALDGTRVYCLTDVGTALRGPALEAARFIGLQGPNRLTLVAWGFRPAGCDPAAAYAALGWTAMEAGGGNGAGLRRVFASCARGSLPAAVFAFFPESGEEAAP